MVFSAAILTRDCDVKARSKIAAAVAIMMHVTASECCQIQNQDKW